MLILKVGELMRIRNVKNASEIINNSKYFIKYPKEERIDKIFNNEKPIHLEIGCGKGKFITEMAVKYPNINFIGYERSESIILRAIQKAEERDLPNLRFICADASDIKDIFYKDIDLIYLNFSDPWPKKRHAKRRLTHENFLKVYDDALKGRKEIIMKTDNDDLFCFSVESFSKYGYIIEEMCIDLHKSDIENIKTEYEEKFSEKGFTIKYVKVIKD